MTQYRIVEEIDGNNKSVFYPEWKGIFGLWFRYLRDDGGLISYSSKDEALWFINHLKPKKDIIHVVD